jgi:hypothetical protein
MFSMNEQQALMIAVAFARQSTRPGTSGLCGACVEVLDVTGAGITLMGSRSAGPVCVSNAAVAALEDVQFATGQGPSHDAFRSGTSVHTPMLDTLSESMWPSFVGVARSHGIGAVFSYPLITRGAKIGVLSLYQHQRGDLSATQLDTSITLVNVLTETVLSLQGNAQSGTLAVELDAAVAYRAQIHQATGMVSVQLGVPVSDSMLRIRAHAFSTGLPVAQIASDIVARRLRLSNDRDELESDGGHSG